MPRRLALVLLCLLAVPIAWAAWGGVDAWRFRAAMAGAMGELTRGRPGGARDRLVAIEARWPGRGEVAQRLAQLEMAGGRVDEAVAAWGRVKAGSPGAGPIALRRGTIAVDNGRLAVAEEALRRALREGDVNRDEALSTLARTLRLQGRDEEVRALLIDGLGQSAVPAELLRELWLIDAEPPPVEGLRGFLEKAGRDAPDDDRVWLGKATLATRMGRLDEAGAWLDRCEARRPGDPAVWRARVDLAKALNDPEAVRTLLAAPSAGRLRPVEAIALRAWFAAHRGDRAGERAALESLLEAAPGSSEALDRLAGLAAEEGQAGRAAEHRRRKGDLDREREGFKKALARGDLDRAGELSRRAEALGRRIESRGWAILASEPRNDRPRVHEALAKLARDEPATLPAGSLLAEIAAANAPGKVAATRARSGAIPTFVDDAAASGLRFTFDNGQSPGRQFPESGSGGVALIDFDGDGWLDVYCIQGGKFPPPPGPTPMADRLFRNRRDGTFEDATGSSGLASFPGGYGHGVAVGDYDNDGHPDLFVTRWRSYALYRNRGDGTFEDATARVGLGGDRDWPTSAAFADLDNDGDLDLYVCHYLVWDAENPRVCRHPKTGAPSYCDPSSLPHRPDHVFRNDGGTYVDVTTEAGFVDPIGRGLGVIAADFDDDGKIDLYVANDMSANYLFHNKGGFRFEEVAAASGVAANASGGYQAGMGVSAGDLDGDGRLDLAVTNFYGESTTLFRNLGSGSFADETARVGLAVPTRFVLGFGVGFLDADSDGHLDLLIANGHVNDFRPDTPYAMPTQLLLGDGRGRLTDVTRRIGPPLDVPRVGRGLAIGDLDNDGRVDAVLVPHNEPVVLLRNRSPREGHFLTLRLVGTASNRDAVGARVRVEAGGRRRVAQRVGGGSYQSANDPRLHFGLGASTRVDAVEVLWPSGRVDRFEGLAADRGYTLREADGRPGPLAGFLGK